MPEDKKNPKKDARQAAPGEGAPAPRFTPAANIAGNAGPDRGAAAGATGRESGATASVAAEVKQRTERFLMAPRALHGQAQPMALDMLASAIDSMPDVQVVRRLRPRGFNALSAGAGAGTEVLVTEMTAEKGLMLQRSAPSNVIIEPDSLLQHHHSTFDLLRAGMGASILPPATTALRIQLRVVGADGQPLPNATVYLYGQAFPAQGKTDASGQVTLDLFGGPVETVQALYVKPERDHWERFIRRPALAEGSVNTISLDPLAKTFPNFPAAGMVGWGQRLMGLDQLAAGLTGAGVKVGIIDSGCDSTHPQLLRATGVDLTADDGGDGWRNDEVHHGTHCAGIIGAAASQGQEGIRGFAPGAELHAFKVFPGGRFSNLIDALDLCIERQIDVVNMSLGSPDASELVQQKIVEATNSGVACIVAAGNSSGPVQFPGVLPQVLTVAAIGQLEQFPADTYHAETVLAGSVGPQNIFAAKFSCFGPQIKVCAPGVAIVSTVPGGYAAWDGTSMATPHVTGLAALVLAHHPLFQGRANRSGQRVAQLFQLLQQSAAHVLADPARGGAGLPLASQIFGTAAVGAGAAAPAPRPAVAAGNGGVVQTPAGAGGAAPAPVPVLAGGSNGQGGMGAGGFGGGFGRVPGYGWPAAPGAAYPPAALQQIYTNPAALNYLLQLRARGLI